MLAYPLFLILFLYITTSDAISFHLTREDKLEDIVEDVVAPGAIWKKLEGLSVVHWSLLFVDLYQSLLANVTLYVAESCMPCGSKTYQKSTSHKDQDTARLAGWLGIKSSDLVFNLLERKLLQCNY